MSRTYLGVAAAALTLCLTTIPVTAHHSIAAEYDFDKPVELTGTLTKIDWVNPHSIFHLEVTAADGTKTMWIFQTGFGGTLRRMPAFAGKKVVGGKVTINGFAAKNGKTQAFIKSVVMPDGENVTMWFGDPNG